MRLLFPAIFAVSIVLATQPAKRYYETHDYYVLEHIPLLELDDVVKILGVEVVEQAGELRDTYLVRALKSHVGLDDSSGSENDRVMATLEGLRTRATTLLLDRAEDGLEPRAVVSSVKYLARQHPRQRTKRAPPPVPVPSASASASHQAAAHFGIKDPLFPEQWHLVNDEFSEYTMNVTPVWDMGFTGKGVYSSLVDDGLDYEHEDLAANFDADNSYDFNDHVSLPTPKLSDDHHGTRCAGQVAAVKNTVCGMGIAYDSKVAGVRILSGPITDVDEAAALNYGYQNISIYSCSWGPPDTGKSMEGPGYLIKKAFVNGINKGRGGKGSIFVFASGNGAASGDQCNFDGYTNSIYSVTVSAIDYKGLHPYYSESCAANLIVAYSSGSGRHIVTTDKGKGACTQAHGGTSAAAPNAVGVFALALEARPDLTWRDIQHLCVETARIVNPDDPDWEVVSDGRKYSYKYGFGVLDAYLFVTAAQSWELVKPQVWITSPTIRLGNGSMDSSGHFEGGVTISPGGVHSTLSLTREMLTESNFESLEHINVRVWIDHTNRGSVEVSVTSPHGIKSILASRRSEDHDTTGYPGWTFMSVKHWGEDPVGDWGIHVLDQNVSNETGRFHGWNMIFWGSAIDPQNATLYEVVLEEDVFPPQSAPARPTLIDATSTKQHVKPTAHLPGDHGSASGENTRPAFPTAFSTLPSTTFTSIMSPTFAPSNTPTPDEGWFSDMANLVTNQKWFFASIGLVAVFALCAIAYFFYRRILQRRREIAAYGPVAGEDLTLYPLPTSSVRDATVSVGISRGGKRGAGRTRELYDAFGEVSEEEDTTEETPLRPPEASPTPASPVAVGLEFHSEFLDDDDTPTTPSGSGESWEHASGGSETR